MCDIDSGSDFDVGSDVGSDYENDVSADSSFEGLDSVDDTSYDTFDEINNFDSDFESDISSDFESLDSVDDTDYESFNEESEVAFAEFADDGAVTDLTTLDDIEDEEVEERFGEQVETMMEISEMEDAELRENVESSTSELLAEEIETLIENTNDVEQLYELRDSLVNGDIAEPTFTEDFESLEETENVSVNEETTDIDWDQLTLNELSDETSYSEPELVVTEDEVQELIENETDPDRLEALRDSLLSGEISVETDETADDDSPKVLTRDITPEIIESRDRDAEETLDNYRDNLQEYGVAEEQIEEFIEQEREKINAEYESLDRGDISSNIYYQPTDWEEAVNSLTVGQAEQLSEYVSNELDAEQEVKQANAEFQELNINYDEIYEGIQQEALEESFADIHIDADPGRLDNSLENFSESTWENLTLDEQKVSMENLADYVVDVIGFENPPKIEYYSNEQEGDFGGYDSSTNTLHINEYMLYNSDEAADTIAHELWHAHQYECAINPQNARDYQYQYNFENYIPPELGQEAYEAQLVEAEARAFAAQFKDRLSMIKGRSI